MTEERKRFERYMAEYRPSLWFNYTENSTRDPRWILSKNEVDQCWHLWQAAAR